MSIYIRILRRGHNGLEDSRDDYSSDQMAGQVPVPGDLILSPWLNTQDKKPVDPENRTFYEVTRRIFYPRNDGAENQYVGLEVTEIPAATMGDDAYALIR